MNCACCTILFKVEADFLFYATLDHLNQCQTDSIVKAL